MLMVDLPWHIIDTAHTVNQVTKHRMAVLQAHLLQAQVGLFQHHQQSSTSTSQPMDSVSFCIPWCPAPSLRIMVHTLPVLLRLAKMLADYTYMQRFLEGCTFMCCVTYLAAAMLMCVFCVLLHPYVLCALVAPESYALHHF